MLILQRQWIFLQQHYTWLNGNYKGNVKKIEEAVSHFIDIEKLREGRINIDFVETSVAQDVFNIAKVCHVENEIGVCCGVAGVGKTFAGKFCFRKYTKN